MDFSVKEIFEEARTCNSFSDKEIPESLLSEIYNIVKFGPTSANCSPLRIVFVKSPDAKAKLLGCLMEGNIAKTKTAPIIAIFAEDHNFTSKMPELFPHNKEIGKMFETSDYLLKDTAYRNTVLQAAYFMMVARSKGLDCGPMSGFFPDKINEAFFLGTNHKVNFICNLGYKSKAPEHPRLPRLKFEDACIIS